MYTFDSRIRYSEIDRSGRLSIPAVVDYFQDCSAFQSEELGVGVEYLANKKRTWILNSWQIVLERRPEECEKITVGTWGSGFDKFHATRNFIMKTTQGERLAYANSIWVYINTETGMPVRPTKEEIDVYKLEAPLEMEYEPRKIKLSREWEEKEPVKVQRSWIDSNDHVNNSWYVKTAFEQLPQDLEIRQLRVEYKKQAYEGDILYPRYAREEQRTLVALCDEKQKPYAVIECRQILDGRKIR